MLEQGSFIIKHSSTMAIHLTTQKSIIDQTTSMDIPISIMHAIHLDDP